MPVDAVWIVITVPKEEYERIQDVKGHKPAIHYEDTDSPVGNRRTNNLNNNLRNANIVSLGESDEKGNKSLTKSLEKILEESLKELEIQSTVWISSKDDNYYHVYFPLDLYDNDATLNFLRGRGIGCKKDSSIGYIPFGLFFQDEDSSSDDEDEGVEDDDDVFASSTPGEGKNGKNGKKLDIKKDDKKTGLHTFKKIQEEFLKSVTSRLTVAQVVTGVRASAELTFDFLMYTIFAGCIAAAGLLNNSAVDVAAAMMIEPVMATVMAITFGLVIRDPDLTRTGVRSCIISLIICLVVGYVYGVILFFWKVEWHPPPDGYWPTGEMSVRGEWRTLIYGTLQALAAGGAIAVTLLNDNQAALVGVAVASTFLPPFINTGLLWAYATHITVQGHYQVLEPYEAPNNVTYLLKKAWMPMEGYKPVHYYDQRWEFMALSGVSMIYTLVNIVCMLAMAYVILRVKEVVPLGRLEPNNRFFAKDIKVAREYNRRMTMAGVPKVSTTDGMGDQILSEWAEIAGLDAGTLMANKPEAEVTRRQTLYDIIADVHQDNTYQSVTSSAVGTRKNTGSGGSTFLRRLTADPVNTDQLNPMTHGSFYRRASINPLAAQQIYGLDVEANTLGVINHGATTGTGNRGRFFVTKDTVRRGSKWTPSATGSASPNMSISSVTGNVEAPLQRQPLSSSGSIGRGGGLRPAELDKGRRTSVFLQKSLREADHSPFSLWPSSSGQPDLRRRKSAVSFSRRASRIPNIPSPTPGVKGAINESFESD